jgi:hypothetical protein
MAVIAVQQASPSGVAISGTSAAEGGDQVPNNGKTLLVVFNGSGSSINVTITPTNTVAGFTIAPVVVAVAGTSTKYLGPYPATYFNNSSGRLVITYSAVTQVTVSAIQL